MAEQESISEQQITAPAAQQEIKITGNDREKAEAFLRMFPSADDAILAAKSYCIREKLGRGASGPIIRCILKLSKISEDKHRIDERKRAVADGESDVSLFIDELREKARKDPVWARIYWDAIKHRQSDDEIPQETRDKAAQVVAAAVDELVQGLAPCCADAVRDLVKRITGLDRRKK